MELEEFYDLKKQVDEANRETAQIEGRIKQVRSQLKKDFGCSTVADLQKLLDKELDELQALETKISQKQRQFRKRWQNVLER